MALPRIYKYRASYKIISAALDLNSFRPLDFSSALIMILFYHPCHYVDFSAMTNFEDGALAAEKQHQKCMVIKNNRCQRHKSYSRVRGNDHSHLNAKLFASRLCLDASAKGKQSFF